MAAHTPAHDERRWVALLGAELVVFSAALFALFATGITWFVLPALLAAPIAGPLSLAYLGMSSDTNRASG